MPTRLVQKHLLKGMREFEIVDDAVEVRVKPPFKDEESLSVMLTVLNPEPVVTRSSLEFVSRVNGCTLISMFLANPNAEEFNAFVNTLKQRAQEEYNLFSGLRSAGQPALGGNVYDEPPDFDNTETLSTAQRMEHVDVGEIENAVDMLQQYVDDEEVRALVVALQALHAAPDEESHLLALIRVFDSLTHAQGAVLTYAPYLGKLMSDDPSGGW